MSGSWTSSSTRSGRSSFDFASASAPSAASATTENPSASRSARAVARKLGWSSTIKTVRGMGSSLQVAGAPAIRIATHFSAAEARPAADAEPFLQRSILLPILLCRPDEDRGDEEGHQEHEHAHHDLGGEVHQISA